jgi:hypothetical protein
MPCYDAAISANFSHDMNTLPVFQPELLCVVQLAKVIHKSVASIRSDASRNPSALPPICRLPGNRRLLWRLEDVQAWLAGSVERRPQLSQLGSHLASNQLKRRGRPRKTEAAA